MSIRLSKSDLERLGINKKALTGDASEKKTKPRKKPVGADEEGNVDTPKSKRMTVRHYGDDIVRISIDVEPRPKQRARVAFNKKAIENAFLAARGDMNQFRLSLNRIKAVAYTPEETKVFENYIRSVSSMQMKRAPFDCPVSVKILIKFASADWPTDTHDGDTDNIVKAVLDALNGVAYIDDKLVVDQRGRKIPADKSGIDILIAPVNKNDVIAVEDL